MFKTKCMFLCFCFVLIGCEATNSLVPFINKCKWNDKQCLLESTKKALPYVGAGLSDLGLEPLDPLKIDRVEYHEGDLKIIFKDLTVTGATRCNVLDVERNLEESTLQVKADCPIDVQGTYSAKGKLFTALLEGDGPFVVKTDKIHISVKVPLTTVDGKDGQEHWQVGKAEHTYEPIEKVTIEFTNLFNGDPEKAELAEAIQEIFHQSWKELVLSIGKPIVSGIMNKIVDSVQILTLKVPISDLEIKT